MLQIEHLRELAGDSDNVILTIHMLARLRERNIEYSDIIGAINNGKIIEQYPNDYPHPSCLVIGTNPNGKCIHVVCGTNGEYLWIITAYYPDTDKWESDFMTRKEKKQ